MPKKRPRNPTHKDAEFARDMLEVKADKKQLMKEARKWRLDVQEAMRLLEEPRREEKRRNPLNRM
tara:strand:- start:148 stop:342 length:195 start_codon:yes stop_codon:yes gene_type:complete